MVVAISYIDVAGLIHCDAGWRVENSCGGCCAIAAEGLVSGAGDGGDGGSGDLAYALVVRIGDIDVAAAIDCDG